MMGKMRQQNNANLHRRRRSSSSSSSIDSNTNSCGSGYHEYHGEASCSSSCLSSTNIHNNNYYCKDHLSTDLRLGLNLSYTQDDHFSSSSPRGQYSDWPPIKGHLRNTLAGKSNNHNHSRPTPSDDQDVKEDMTLFVKVYMQGLPIGRKLDLLSIDGYHTLISTLSLMFKTTILYSNIPRGSPSENCHILTYEDKEGDWMMVGDVPWELFLTTVKRLKIVTLDSCQ